VSANCNRWGLASNTARIVVMLLALAGAACGGGYGGGGGNASASPTVSLSVQPTSISVGQSATLNWTTSSASSCAASGAWSGTQATSGNQVVAPAAAGSIKYTLTCMGGASGSYGGGGGSVSASATLTVSAATGYTATKLAADSAGVGALTADTNLVNPWGIAFAPGKPAWVANNRSGTATVYDGNGKAQPSAGPLVIHLPSGAAAVAFGPTGMVANVSSVDFTVSAGQKSGVARFIFAGEAGMIAGWSNAVDPNPVVAYVDAGGAVYKGLALANNGSANFLYAADFHNNKIDVFNASFARQLPTASSFAFSDPTLPAGYAPFGIQAIDDPAGTTRLYVAYARQQTPDNRVDADGAGLGLVNVFDTNGNLLKHLIPAGGALNAPWGMALAPGDFGSLSNALLVGNHGDGRINGYDPASGQFIGTVQDAAGAPFAEPGLWGIAFGNDGANQPDHTLFFAAGINDQASGLYGRIDLGPAPALNEPPTVILNVPAGNLTGTVTLTATVTDAERLAIASVKFFANNTLIGTASAPPFSLQWDSTTVAAGPVTLTASATDADGNVGTSQAVPATVGAAAVTLTQLQTQVFTPLCSGCHNGSQPAGGPLPGSQDLTAGHTFSSIVGVHSIEQPTLMRVQPNDPDNSYLIHKVEGATGITGARMPLGGPALSQSTIDQIRSWISSGAQNN
jgi:uncharacterized protein (TIGR03118 family)